MTPEQIIKLTDSCVKCGLCLPHCPTYCKMLQESDSPRGRIAIVHGLLTGTLQDSPRIAECLDRCLECHACESACPSGTPVTHIIDAIRALRMGQQVGARPWLRQRLLGLAIRPGILIPWLRRYQSSSLRLWVQKLQLLQYLGLEYVEQLLPKHPMATATTGVFTTDVVSRWQQHLALFPGCLGRFLDAAAIEAAMKILTRLGYKVSIPSQNCCCGALYRHDGFAIQADQELAQSVNLFAGYERVLTMASACLVELRQAHILAGIVEDATGFIAAVPWPAELILDTTPQHIWVHVPCTQRQPIGNPKAAITLLARIPGVTTMTLPDNDICCGAAGTYMLRQPELSQALLADKLQLIATTTATVVTTTNTGCALRLATSLQAQGSQVRVCHPLEILAERLQSCGIPNDAFSQQ